MTAEPIDIHSGATGPGGLLSNFAPYAFMLDGVACGSMEGLLQSLKTSGLEEQRRIAALTGWEAYHAGQRHDWKREQCLHWQGQLLPRLSPAYQHFLDRAYGALAAQVPAYQVALLATRNAPLTHVHGKTNPADTVLTQSEMVDRLTQLRTELQGRR